MLLIEEAECADLYCIESNHRVHCDFNCGAKEHPTNISEYISAWLHWRQYRYMSGCPHGC